MKPQKQPINVSFAQGVDTKTDPKQVQIGKFLSLQNSVFTNGGELQKRNGYKQLASLPSSNYSYLTTFHDDLTAVGKNIAAYNIPNSSWVSKGQIEPLSLSTLPVIRNNLNQTSMDIAVAPNGLACVVYLENNAGSISNKYAVYDSTTGQNIIAPSFVIPSSGTISGGMRVFILGTYFLIISTYTTGGNSFLQYYAIDYTNVANTVGPQTLSNAYTPFSTLSWDAVVAPNGNLYYAYNVTAGGQKIEVSYLTPGFINTGLLIYSGASATMMNLCVDTTSTPVIYLAYYAPTSAFVLAFDQSLTTVMPPVRILTAIVLANITCAAQNGTCTVFYEDVNAYSYDSTIPTNFVGVTTVTPNATTFTSVFTSGAATITASSATGLSSGEFLVDVTTPANIAAGTTFTISGTTLTLSNNTAGNSASSPGDTLRAVRVVQGTISLRSVGLASKAFIYNGVIYYLATYQSSYQPTYFLVNGSLSTSAAPVIAAKLAYSNGGGYLTTGLPNVPQNGAVANFGYLFKDLIQAVNKNTNVPSGSQTAGIYSQTGVNMATVTFGTSLLDTIEIGNDLHISGGFLWMYDGYLPLEHNFFLWPDNVEVATQADPVTTGNTTNLSKSVTSLASVAGIAVGMHVTGTGIQSGTLVTAIAGTTITLSLAATATNTGTTLTFTGNQVAQQYYYQVTYEWTDNQGNAFRSAPSIPVSVTTSGGNSSVVVNIPTLRVTMKTANPVKIVIYRWSVAQQNYYQVTSITSPLLNDPTVDQVQYIDGASDATILGNNLIYTTGGVVEDVNAPASNLFTLFDSRLWLVDAEDPNLVWFSKQVIESTPVEMSDLFTIYIPPNVGTNVNTGPITSIATMDDKILFGKANAWVYINGAGPDNTGANNGYSQAIFITSTVGCTNQRSIVLTPNGLMFQSDKGIWLIDRGLSVSYIGAPVQSYTQGVTVTSAVLVPETTQVRFTLSSGITLMYDYFYEQWGTFNTSAISSCIFQDLHTLINGSAVVTQENPGSYLDITTPVTMSFQTGPIRLGDVQNYQRVWFFYLLGSYYSPHYLALSMTYDYEPTSSQTVTIQPGAEPGIAAGNTEMWRIFPTRQRCQAISLTLQETYDSTLGPSAGAGLTLSSVNFICGFKRGFRPQAAAQSAG